MLVSLKKYTKETIISDSKKRFEKIASLLDDTDYEDQVNQALSWLDQAIFTPRVLLIKPTDFITYNGGSFVDVTGHYIDVINNVYFQEDNTQTFNTILPEVGLLPLLTGGNNITQLSQIITYIQLKTNLNMLNRQLDSDGDYELWSPDEDGKQLLQLRKQGLTKVEYLPSISMDATEYYLYEFEYAFLKDMIYAKCNLFNAEMQLSAQSLGVGKEASNLTNYWQNKIDNINKEFLNHVVINYMA